jgi:hypothetical protein
MERDIEVKCECGAIVGVYYDQWRENWALDDHYSMDAEHSTPYCGICTLAGEGFYDSQIVTEPLSADEPVPS